MLNKFIISFLAIALIAVPAAASAALAMDVSGQMAVVHQKMADMDDLLVLTDIDECHKVEESDCCKTECGCCVAHFFPMSSNITEPLSFAPVKSALLVDDLAEPTADRLIRPPIIV